MRLEHDGMTLWFGTADAPAPSETEAPDRDLAVTVAVQPIDASNRVEIRYRRNRQGPEQALPIEWIWNDPQRDIQYFRGKLPPFQAGDQVEYAAICSCSGRQVPASDDVRYQGTFRIAAPATEAFVSAPVSPPGNCLNPSADVELAGTDENRPKAARLAASSQMIEDYLLTRTPLFTDHPEGRFAIIEREVDGRTFSEFGSSPESVGE